MAVTCTTNDDTRIAELVVDGRVTREDFDSLAPAFSEFVARHDKVKLIEVVRRLDGWDSSLLWEGIKLDAKAIPRISHCAVVGDMGWLTPVARAAGAVTPMTVRVFPLAELDAARDWIATADQD